jgi:hypothetical protein
MAPLGELQVPVPQLQPSPLHVAACAAVGATMDVIKGVATAAAAPTFSIICRLEI